MNEKKLKSIKRMVVELNLQFYTQAYMKYMSGPGSATGGQSELSVDTSADQLKIWMARAWAEYLERYAKGKYNPKVMESVRLQNVHGMVDIPKFDAEEIATALILANDL